MKPSGFLRIGFLLPALCCGQTFFNDVDINDPPDGVIMEEWASMYLNDEKVGYFHNILKRDDNEIHTLEETFMKMGRGDSGIVSLNTSETREMIDGSPISMSDRTWEGDLTKTKKVVFTPEGATVTISDGTREWTREVDLEPGFVLSWSFIRQLVETDPAPGQIIESQMYIPDLVIDRTLPVSTKIFDKEILQWNGAEIEAYRIEQTIRLGFLPLKMTAWTDEAGNLLKATLPMGGMDLMFIATTEKEAKAAFTPPDVFTNSLIPLNRPIPPDAANVTFSLRSDSALLTEMPESANQSVLREADGSFRIEVKSGNLAFVPETGEPPPPQFLAASPFVDYKDPAIVDLIDQADLDGKTPEEKIRTLVRVADETITIKSLDLGFASASEAVALNEGDCTEHALLLTALVRAAGFPARGASGIVYFEDESGSPVMGYHMWTQVWNGSGWLDLDAAFGTAETDPIRILFNATDLNDPILSEEILSLLAYVGQTKISVESVTTGN